MASKSKGATSIFRHARNNCEFIIGGEAPSPSRIACKFIAPSLEYHARHKCEFDREKENKNGLICEDSMRMSPCAPPILCRATTKSEVIRKSHSPFLCGISCSMNAQFFIRRPQKTFHSRHSVQRDDQEDNVFRVQFFLSSCPVLRHSMAADAPF